MKKFILFTSIILINILLFWGLDCLFFCYYDAKQTNLKIKDCFERYLQFLNITNFDDVYKYYVENNLFRDFEKQTEKRPILIFGCSFGFGFLLEPEASFSYKLSQYSNRSVYNRAISGFGLQHFPYMLEHYDIDKSINSPEYILFVMIDNHLYRLYREILEVNEPTFDISYKLKNDVLEERKPWYTLFLKSAIIRYINLRTTLYTFENKDKNKIFDFMKAHFLKAKSLINKKFPNSKIVIFLYEEGPDSWIFNSPRWKELEDEGFIIINSFDLTNEHLYEDKYKIKNDLHPNEDAWNILTPKIVEKLGL